MHPSYMDGGLSRNWNLLPLRGVTRGAETGSHGPLRQSAAETVEADLMGSRRDQSFLMSALGQRLG